MTSIKSFNDLEIYQLSRKLEIKIYELSKKFPREEKYSLTDQIRRSSRSIKANIAEGWGKRVYVNQFKRHLIDALGSLEETKSWIETSQDCSYISCEDSKVLIREFDNLAGKIINLRKKWKNLQPDN